MKTESYSPHEPALLQQPQRTDGCQGLVDEKAGSPGAPENASGTITGGECDAVWAMRKAALTAEFAKRSRR